MTTSPLQQLSALGQSVWIDALSRDSIRKGGLQKMIDEDAVVGATSNPTIFAKAMASGNAYDEQMHETLNRTTDPTEVFWILAERDIQDACDVFAPVFKQTGARDGYVSLEVDPRRAYDTAETTQEAARLSREVDRPNLLVKIPATEAGLNAIEESIASGISINVTLIFSLGRYDAVSDAYLRGLERLIANGGDPSKVASVASFFVSRIDTEADRRLDEIGGHDELKGKLAIANAKLAYAHYKGTVDSPRWKELAAKGATPQRLLWASTSTKNPDYPDTLYVDELAGPDTVNTMPEETIKAYQDHGHPDNRLEKNMDEAHKVLEEFERIGISYDEITETVEREGVEKFVASFDELLQGLGEKIGALSPA